MHLQKASIHLRVGDTGQSIAFYEALLGAPPTSSNGGMVVFESEAPALVLVLETRLPFARTTARPSGGPHVRRKYQGERKVSVAHNRFTLIVPAPEQVGQTAIALRRAGARLRLQDEGLEASDPDGNEWNVRFVPFARVRAVVEIPVEHAHERT